LKRAVLAKIDKVKHTDCVGFTVADIGIFTVTIGNVRESAAVATEGGEQKQERRCSEMSRT
jgi:hypothetical protein